MTLGDGYRSFLVHLARDASAASGCRGVVTAGDAQFVFWSAKQLIEILTLPIVDDIPNVDGVKPALPTMT